MSYANGTTHYNLPQTVGTDKRDWFDTNQAFANVDADLYSAKETADSTASNVATIQGQIVTIQSDIETAEGNISTLQGGLATANENIGLNSTKIAEVKADALDMISAIDEGTAQVASVAVTNGQYFRYNDVLYIATEDINIGDTIVPNTNCRATNVGAELVQLNTDLSKHTFNITRDLDADTIYIAENDGYLTFASPTEVSDSYYTNMYINGLLMASVTSNASFGNVRNSIYLRKDMTIKFSSNGTGASATFYPLS